MAIQVEVLLLSNHLIVFANFENFVVSPGFIINFKKGRRVSKPDFKEFAQKL